MDITISTGRFAVQGVSVPLSWWPVFRPSINRDTDLTVLGCRTDIFSFGGSAWRIYARPRDVLYRVCVFSGDNRRQGVQTLASVVTPFFALRAETDVTYVTLKTRGGFEKPDTSGNRWSFNDILAFRDIEGWPITIIY